ncbi:serine/threonine protein kinase [Corallincola holothuriorum]|uniref:Serine/threonine protein kinase n=1 Tax=Corallincola holothuriorum TaxID=2282215 RepID=A0A368NS22_9GAMM|nr:serine/threonine-protein kinase [Corallincola holothuriorum]RCU52743.1 serine/threonine protein kinase [Corallincola holothuriorum]
MESQKSRNIDPRKTDGTATTPSKPSQPAIAQNTPPSSADKTLIRSESGAGKRAKKPTTDAPNQLIGKVINGRYKIDSLLGRGGMSDVYKAHDLLLQQAGLENTAVAIKILQKQFVNQPEARQLLVQEARRTQQLSHPNIIRVYDYGFEAGQHYMVMEWLDGETLEAVIKRSRPIGLPYKNAKALLNQLADALSYAHSQGVVHADLKPANIMLTRDGTIKVFDFGVAHAKHKFNDKYSAVIANTNAPVNGYTPTYASPELIAGKEPKTSDDIYAFSCIAYELASSKHPFDRQPADIAKKQNISAKKPKHIPWWRWFTLRSGLAFSADSRIGSMAEFTHKFNRNLWPLATTIMLTSCLVFGSAHIYRMKQDELLLVSAELQAMRSEANQDQAIAALSAAELIKLLPEIPEHKQLFINGVLRSNRTQLLSFYEQRIDDILNNRDGTYPDYYAIESELNAAKTLYPDSNLLARLDVDLLQRWQSTVDILDERFNKLLEKGNYAHSEDGDDIYQLLAELKTIENRYRPNPTEKAEQLFAKEFNTALASHDVTQLNVLIDAGEVAFSESPSLNDLILLGKELKSAVAEVANYQRQLGLGNAPDYPYEAADIFYHSTFNSFDERLKHANTVAKIDKINKDVNALARDLPGDFTPLVKIRRSLANRYLNFSNSFIKQRKVRSAQKLMEKANTLFAQLEAAQVAL